MSRLILTSHVLDTSSGRPAPSLIVELYKKRDEGWTLWHSAVTTGDGRVQFPFSAESMPAATYKLKFHVADYFKAQNKDTIYDYVEVVFTTAEGQHYHIPLILSPFGYTTYRGS